MPTAKIPKVQVQKIPWFKQYLLISLVIALLITAATIYFGIQAKDTLLYPRLSVSDAINNADLYQDQPVDIKGQYLNFATIQKPICTPQGGNVQFPTIVPGYHQINADWGLTDGTTPLGVKLLNAQGQEISGAPNYQNGQQIELKGRLRHTTVRDDCNLDQAYNSVYLEVTQQK